MKLVGAATVAAGVVLALASGCSGTAAQTGDSAGSPSSQSSATALGSATSSGDATSGRGSASASASVDDPSSGSGSESAGTGQPALSTVEVSKPSALNQPLLSSDVLVYGRDTLPQQTIDKIRGIDGVVHVERFSMGSFYVDERQVTYAAVNPSTFRRFTVPGTAQTQEVWDRVAAGEIAIEPKLGRKLQGKDGYLRLGNETEAKRAHIGAYAQILDPGYARHIDAVLNYKWAKPLGMTRGNALLVAMGSKSPQSVRTKLQQYAGNSASIQILGPDLDLKAAQTAILTGGSVAAAVGKFNYTADPSGRINPDPQWVASNIRTEVVPILGPVRCHRVMLPQLRAALNEIVTRGLADKIHKSEYGGCYYPRFIGYNPANGLSFHSFGTAIDLNVPENQRGTAGQMDPTVVSIFKKWGFAWGGDWSYTDPMHFELARLVHVG